MKLKSTLWALAFACAAVSCSDDLDEGPNNGNNGQEMNGTKTFMQVSINTGVVTRATGGEEGDSSSDKGETGKSNEYEVKDVTVVLFKNASGTAALTAFNYDSKLVAAGYVQTPGTSTGTENWHNRVATVEIDITDASEDFDGKTYGIIAVTNLGSAEKLKNRIKSDDINTGSELANLLQEQAWSETNGNETDFIMSTHNDQYGTDTKLFDCVTLHANATSENAPRADVHVERLAAKVRIGAHTNASQFIYSVEGENANDVIAKVRLDQVQLVNKQNRGTYLLKRVSENVTDETTKEIPTQGTNGDKYLANEVWNSAAGQTAFNYVIDPWSRKKVKLTADNKSTITNITGVDITSTTDQIITLNYENAYNSTSFSTLWTTISNGAITLASNETDFTNSEKKTISYTLENTVSAEASQAGYMTGALFKATYFPKEYMAVTQENGQQVVKPIPVDYNGKADGEGFDNIDKNTDASDINFYVYNGNVYKDHEAIFNEYVWNEQKNMASGVKVYAYSDFNATNVTKIKIKDLMGSTLMQGAANDPFGYLQALKTKYKDQTTSDNNLTADDAFDQIVSATSESEDIKKKLAAITLYEDCICYYPYWIKHADNNKTTDMGVMEFGIVRNNIYDLAVSKITKLGLSGTDVPDPTEPGESKELRFIVDINVKNWVVRSNSDIIL